MPSHSEEAPLDIAIIGGGISGMVVAIGLLKRKISFTIYESARCFNTIGGGLAFLPNAVRAMELIDPSIRKAFERVAFRESDKNVAMHFLFGQDLCEGRMTGDTIGVNQVSPTQATVHRADFLDELVKMVPAEYLRFGKRVVAIDDNGEKGIRLAFKDGTEASHACVIGCDGIKSEVRRYILGLDNPQSYAKYSGGIVYRALLPMEQVEALLGYERSRRPNVWLAERGHIIQFPVQKGKLVNIGALVDCDEWTDKDWVVPTTREEMMAAFSHWGEPIQKLVDLVEKPDIWAMFDHPECDTFAKGRVTILGDAAHASTPHQGGGAGMAIEDAYILCELLGSCKGIRDVEGALKGYDVVRRSRTLKMVHTSREASRLWGLRLEGVGSDPAKLLPNIKTRMKWIMEEDFSKELERAKAVMANAQ